MVAADVTDEANDKQQAQPLLPQAVANTGQAPRIASMDTGYFSEANVTPLTALGCTPPIPPDRQLHGQMVPAALRADRQWDCRWLTGCAARRTGDGAPPGAKRSSSRCSARSSRAAAIGNSCCAGGGRCAEHGLICTTHNVRKLWWALGHRPRGPAHRLHTLSGSRRAERKAQGERELDAPIAQERN
ncbi:MAG: hypothetical protein NNA31_12495 [Nitrospira sp.]|nr:hypothetical protein [Nitrospira sp.]